MAVQNGDAKLDNPFLNSVHLRGQTPDNIKSLALQTCDQYLAGIWSNISEDQIIVDRISGGLTNQIYSVTLTDDVVPKKEEEENQPRKVILRLYGEKHMQNSEDLKDIRNQRLSDAVIGVLLEERNLGPKLYGVFPRGELQEFVDGRAVTAQDEADPTFVKEVAIKLARFHSLKPPIKKRNDYLRNMRNIYDQAYKKVPIDELVKKLNLTNIESTDWIKEIDWLERVITKLNPPLALIHYDFSGRNMLIRNNPNNDLPFNRVALFDHELSMYSYRSHDFAWLFNFWGKQPFEIKPYPSDDVIKPFLEFYHEECVKIHGKYFEKDKRNSISNLMIETKVFHLVIDLLSGIYMMLMDPIDGVEGMSKEALMVN
jgi:choline/ethanolamine kinase